MTPVLEISISGRDDGTIEAAYVTVGIGNVAKTKEIERGALNADFDSRGKLLGIEILRPIPLRKVVRLVSGPQARRTFSRFMRRSAPKELVLV